MEHVQSATLKPSQAPPKTKFADVDKREDDHFLRLIGPEAWQRLPEKVRHRFSQAIDSDGCIVFRGRVVATQLNAFGWILSRLAWVLRSPLPLDHGATGPAVVVVTDVPNADAQNWVRTYLRPCGRMQTVSSQKRFCGPTGLEEYLGRGVGMTLVVTEEDRCLKFQSQQFYLDFGGWRLTLPRFASPGVLTILHKDLGGGWFRFEMSLVHRLFGRMLVQRAEFQDGP